MKTPIEIAAEKYSKELMDLNPSGIIISKYVNSDTLEEAFLAGVEFQSHRIKRLEDALKFYADKENWRTNPGKVGITPLTDGTDSEIIDGQWTNGKTARAALEKA